MADCIKKSDAWKAVEAAGEGSNGFIADEFEKIPSADVAEVRHGMWLWELADNGWANHICSECGYTKNTDIHVVMDYEYCPHCGARMDIK